VAARGEGVPGFATQDRRHVVQRLQHLKKVGPVEAGAAVAHGDHFEALSAMEGQHHRAAAAQLPVGLGALQRAVGLVSGMDGAIEIGDQFHRPAIMQMRGFRPALGE